MVLLKSAQTVGRVVAAGGVATERIGTNGRVVFAGSVLPERVGTNGRVKIGGGVVPERCSANSGEMVAGGVHEEHSKTNGQVEVGVVVLSASVPMAMLKLPVVLLASAPEPTATLYWPVVS